jgi:hypothetical protein
LSYTWGSAALTKQILIDGHIISVRENLALFLEALTEHHHTESCDQRQRIDDHLHLPVSRLWADYVCINQDDLAEKSSQVALMHRIYKLAAGVCAWLGPSTPDSEHWFNWAESEALRSRSTLLEMDSAGLQRIQDAMSDICNRQYWTRLVCSGIERGY